MFDSRYSANASRWKDRFVAETAWKDSLPVAFQGTSRTRTVNGLDPGVAFASTYTSTACITPREKSRVTFGLPFGPVIARAIDVWSGYCTAQRPTNAAAATAISMRRAVATALSPLEESEKSNQAPRTPPR